MPHAGSVSSSLVMFSTAAMRLHPETLVLCRFLVAVHAVRSILLPQRTPVHVILLHKGLDFLALGDCHMT